MNKIHPIKPAPPYQIKFYTFIGEAISSLQYIENALSRYVIIKAFGRISRTEADQHLKKYRVKTLGQTFKIMKENNLFPEVILNKTEELLEERNWLIHSSSDEIQDGIELEQQINNLASRIKSISIKASELINLIDGHILDYSELNGVDMSGVRKSIEKYYADI